MCICFVFTLYDDGDFYEIVKELILSEMDFSFRVYVEKTSGSFFVVFNL